MPDAILYGILVTALSGLVMGTSPWPLKLTRHFKYEQYAFVSMAFALAVLPWGITLIFCPHFGAALRTLPAGLLLKANIFSVSWGIAQVLALKCFVRIGVGLTYGILCAVGASVGMLAPMIFKASGVFAQAPGLGSSAGLTVMAGAAVMVVGVFLATLAGFGRERALGAAQPGGGTAGPIKAKSGFGLGLVMVVVAGVLSTGWGLAFAYSQGPIIEAMKAQGAGDFPAGIAVWALGLCGAAIVNTAYPAYLLTRNRSWKVIADHPKEIGLALLYGLLFFIPSPLLGKGMLMLGSLGASVGWGVGQGTIILGAQAVGFLSGEWRGVSGRPRRQIYLAIAVLVVSMLILALGNSLAA